MSGGTLERLRVLHVDDDPEITAVTAEYLERHDERFDVDTATSAREGIDRLAGAEYDCIVSDFEMPGPNGIEFLRSVREDHPELPFILYTGKGSETVASEAISARVTDYLQKEAGTSQYEVLANRVRNAIEQFRTKRELDRSQDLLAETERIVDIGGWEYDVEADDLRWTEGTYAIHDLDPESTFDPTVNAAVAFYHPDDRDEIEWLVDRCLESGASYDAELRLLTADDRLRWVRTTGEPVREDGDVVKVRGAIQDVTDRKERERQLERYERIVQNLPVGVFRATADGTVVSANATMISLLDGDPETDGAGTVVDQLYADPATQERLYAEVVEEGIVTERPVLVETFTGDCRWMKVTLTLAEEAGDRYLDGILRHVTEQRGNEQVI